MTIGVAKFQNRSPELDSSFLNRLTLWWFNPIPIVGARKDLELEDLFQLNEGNTSAYLIPRWEALWLPAMQKYNEKKQRLINEDTSIAYRKQTSKSDGLKVESDGVALETKSEVKPPSIVWRLFLMFRYEILTATAVKLMSDVLQFASPFLLKYELKSEIMRVLMELKTDLSMRITVMFLAG
uniref:ABC transmembrane type-1 domain-containing protein n=1 Tax=Parascaris equorum TaxID=6256 RepID=A0A914RTM4_PAREQ